MNIFVLNTGRCGSTTFIKACEHITNYTSAHESRSGFIGEAHFQYPPNHIEADNRLSWFLGRLDKTYGNDAFYVHLKRNEVDTARSFVKRCNTGIIGAYRADILMRCPPDSDPMAACLDYYHTVNSNIESFLKDKTRVMIFSLETAKRDFQSFWSLINAEGNFSAALAEWDIAYNASPRNQDDSVKKKHIVTRQASKLTIILRRLQSFAWP
jgi:hypothetical protein